MLDDLPLITVTDLKQFSYCGRAVYDERCLPHIRPRTFKMDAGRDEHKLEQKRATRRTLRKYAVAEGKRTFDVVLTDPALGLTGILDEVVTSATGEQFPVDYKLANQVSDNHRLQLAAYAHVLEQQSGRPVTQGFVYLIKRRQLARVAITPALRQKLTATLAAVTRTIEREQMPPPTSNRSRCMACEFRRFCNDV